MAEKKKKTRSDKGKTHAKARVGDKRLGNTNWMLGDTGRKKIWENPQEMWDDYLEYEEFCRKEPVYKTEMLRGGVNAGQMKNVPMPHVVSMKGFAVWKGIPVRTLMNYKSGEAYKDFHDIYEMISNRIDVDKELNAMVGNYDPRLYAAVEGLRNKQELEGNITLKFDKDDENL